MKNHSKRDKGFTLVELLVVFSIAGALGLAGIASFVSFNKSQKLNGAVIEFSEVLNTAKSRALSQLKPSSDCTSATLYGYTVRVTDADTYELSAVCDTINISVKRYDFTSGVRFALGCATSSSFQFNTAQAAITGSGYTVITDGSQYRKITVDRLGNIRVEPDSSCTQ